MKAPRVEFGELSLKIGIKPKELFEEES